MAKRLRETHPLVRFGEARGWDYAKTAKHFRVPYSTFKQLVRGFTGVSFSRADLWQRISKGKVTADEVLRWHERNRREVGDAEEAA